MGTKLRAYLERLYDEGAEQDGHDGARSGGGSWRRDIDPESAHLLWSVLLASRATYVVEIGTANGYATTWWADAMSRTGGRAVSVDADESAQARAGARLTRRGLLDSVAFVHQDPAEFLPTVPRGTVDLLFLADDPARYASWWPHPLRVLRPGGLVVVDNAIAHGPDLAAFVQLLDREPAVDRQLVDIGRGLQVVTLVPEPAVGGA